MLIINPLITVRTLATVWTRLLQNTFQRWHNHPTTAIHSHKTLHKLLYEHCYYKMPFKILLNRELEHHPTTGDLFNMWWLIHWSPCEHCPHKIHFKIDHTKVQCLIITRQLETVLYISNSPCEHCYFKIPSIFRWEDSIMCELGIIQTQRGELNPQSQTFQ